MATEVCFRTKPDLSLHICIVLILDDSETRLTIIEEAAELRVLPVAFPSHLTNVIQPMPLSISILFKALLKKKEHD